MVYVGKNLRSKYYARCEQRYAVKSSIEKAEDEVGTGPTTPTA